MNNGLHERNEENEIEDEFEDEFEDELGRVPKQGKRLTYSWNKIYPRDFIANMAEHSPEIVGLWTRCWCFLATSDRPWTKSALQSAWASMLGVDMPSVKRFMNYVQDNLPLVTVKTSIKNYNEVTYTVCDEWYDREEQTRNMKAAKMRRLRKKSNLALNRVEMYNKVLSMYHPKKILIQRTMARNEFQSYMRDCSRNIEDKDQKLLVEEAGTEKILQYIKHLESTEEWNKYEGKYLLGIGKLIKSRLWEIDDNFIKGQEVSGDREKLKTKILDL